MKFLHVSDLHIGKRVNGISLMEDQRYILAQILFMAVEEGAGALIVAGDIYDKASPSAESVTVFDSFITSCVAKNIRVIAVPGNHDSAERIAYAQGLLSSQGVDFPPVFSGQLEKVMLEDEYGSVCVWLLPFLKPGDTRRFFPDIEIGDDYETAIRSALGTCDIDRDTRNVIVSHQLVTAMGTPVERADEEIKLGGIDNIDVSVFEDFDYVALGHVHRPQRVGRDTVRYSGSPLKYSFSEARYGKSVVLVELGAKGAGDAVGECVSVKLIPLRPLHDMREVRMTLEELLAIGALKSERVYGSDDVASERSSGEDDIDAARDTTVEDVDETTGAEWDVDDYLHITLTDEHPQLDAMAKIRLEFPNAMTLDYDNATIVAAHSRALNAADPDKVDMVELFARFYEEQVGKPLDEVQSAIIEDASRKVDSAIARGEGKGEDAR